MHLLVFLPENAIITPENGFFPDFLGPFRANSQEYVLTVEKKRNPDLQSRNSPGAGHRARTFRNHAGKLSKDDPSVVVKNYVPCNGKR